MHKRVQKATVPLLSFNTKSTTVAKRLILQVWKSSSTLDILSWQIGLSELAANGKE